MNSDMTDPVGPGKLVRHMQNPSYASVHAIALGTSFKRYIKEKQQKNTVEHEISACVYI